MNEEREQFDFSGLIILEMANNHQGDVLHGKKIIETYAPLIEEAGVRAAMKLQLRDVDTFIHPDFRDSTEYKHISRFLSARLDKEELQTLVDESKDAGFYAMATPTDEVSVDLADKLGIEILKVASCSAADWPLLEKITDAGKPIVASTGGLSLEEVDNLVSFFKHRGAHFALMHCVSLYPTPNHRLNLERIRVLKDRYQDVVIGFSTHEDPERTDVVKVAYAKGARLFEKHIGLPTEKITLNAYSASPGQFEKWLDAYQEAIAMVGAESALLQNRDKEEYQQLVLQMRGIYAKADMKKGSVISRRDVFFAMPLQEEQISSGQWKEGLIADKDYKANAPLPLALLSDTVTRKQVVYKAIHDVKGLLNSARVPINSDSSVTLLHPNGIFEYVLTGLFVISCFDRGYSKRILVLLPNQDYPASYHKQKEKTLQVLSGKLDIEVDNRRRTLYPGDTILIPAGIWHAFLPSHGAIVEEISTDHADDDVFFVDKEINKKDESERETKLIHWGRHQFDNEP